MRADDLAPLIAARDSGDLGYRQGRILSWNSDTGENVVDVGGTPFTNLAALTSAGMVGLQAGDVVSILRFKTTYFILGRIVSSTSTLVSPQFPVVLYPQFVSNVAPGSTGQWRVNAGVLATWEGRIKVAHPRIEVDGVWGNLSGAGSTTYALKLGGTTVDSWTHTTLSVSRAGPFDITNWIGQDWLKVEIAITASTAGGEPPGEKAFQILGCYFRQP